MFGSNNGYFKLATYLKNYCSVTHYKALLFSIFCLSTALPSNAETLQILTYEESPYAVEVGNNQQGLLVEMLSELFSHTTLDYELRFIPLKRAILTVEHKPGYCVLPIARSQNREASFQWVSPMLISRYGLYSKKKGSIPLISLNDAQPYTIGSFLGSGIAEYLTELGFKVELSHLSSLNLQKLKRGRFELWAEDLLSAQEMMRQQGREAHEPELVFYTTIRAMACHRSLPQAQLKELHHALLTLYQSGFMKQLYQKYGVDM